MSLCIFGYGSLLWRPGFDFCETQVATIQGWERRFWQASPDHRGTPEHPGRVVTLVPVVAARCTGRLYWVAPAQEQRVLDYLDERESGGYSRVWVSAMTDTLVPVRALTYIALSGNPFYLGPAEGTVIEQHIAGASGPSGSNTEYLSLLLSHLSKLRISEEERNTLPLIDSF